MCTIEYMRDCTHVLEVVYNRVKVANQVIGCRYAFNCGNPVVLSRVDGRECVMLCGCEYCVWHRWDVLELRAALERMDALYDCIWYMCRSGRMVMRV